MSIRVTALTGGPNQPSSRFRVRQHIERLGHLGVHVRDVQPRIDRHADLLPPSLNQYRALRWPTKSLMHGIKVASRLPDAGTTWQADLTWLQRELVPGIPSWEPILRRPLVLDVDDAIWHSPPAGVAMAKTLARAADVVVAGNRHLEAWFSPHAAKVEILPTAVDTDRYVPGPTRDDDGFVIGWMGTSSNLGFLRGLEPALRKVLDAVPKARMTVVSNAEPGFESLPSDRVEFIRWSPEGEVPALQSFDVGLMPLADDPWTRGKCAFKMIQYMACGVPAVVSPVGMNADVLDMAELGFAATKSDDWTDALLSLHRDRDRATAMGRNGRAIAEAHFSSDRIATALAGIFHRLV